MKIGFYPMPGKSLTHTFMAQEFSIVKIFSVTNDASKKPFMSQGNLLRFNIDAMRYGALHVS